MKFTGGGWLALDRGGIRHWALLVGCLWLTFPAQAKPPILESPTTPFFGEWDAFWMDTLYAHGDKDTGLKAVVGDERFRALVKKHDMRLMGGPMLGCVTAVSARVWVRTIGSAKVGVTYGAKHSAEVTTTAEDDFAAWLDLVDLPANSECHYDVMVNGVSVSGGKGYSFKTTVAKGSQTAFRLGFGGGARYNPPFERMWDVIVQQRPDAFLFLGDNLYIDLPEDRTKQRVHYYRRQLRPEFTRLISKTAIYSVYDDHDLGKDDCAGGSKPFEPDWKFQSLKVFKENWNNPSYGHDLNWPGCWFDFSIGDVDVFVVDNRYYRDFARGTMLGPVQKDWLLRKLKESKATFKLIASGTLWTENADKGGKDSWWGVPQEREEIFSLIDREKIGGVVLLSADRHRTDVYRIHRPNGYDLYEFESSKLTNDHTHGVNRKALFSYNQGHMFGLLHVDTTQRDPELRFECVNQDGKVVHAVTLRRSELEAK